ncbi:toxin-antitoxin system YwqK family antitoxin [Sinomicrobium sp. M5D2P9]
MKYFSRIIILLILFVSCYNSKKEKEYYTNGSLKYEVTIDDYGYNGSYKEYYEDGTLRIKGSFIDNLKQGLFTEYYKSTDKLLKTETFWKNDTSYYQKNIGKSGYILSEGALVNNRKFGKWKYYDDNEGYLKEIREFFIIKNSTYLNQNWLLNSEQDTLTKGNHYKIISSDTLDYEQQRIYFFLKQPYFSYDSDLLVLIPRNNDELKDDFSNEETIEWDTIDNLANRYKNQRKYGDRNHDVVFDLDYLSAGKKRLRGVLLEKENVKSDTLNYEFTTRKIYFDKEVYIRNKQVD